jgi:hypothetical protein
VARLARCAFDDAHVFAVGVGTPRGARRSTLQTSGIPVHAMRPEQGAVVIQEACSPACTGACMQSESARDQKQCLVASGRGTPGPAAGCRARTGCAEPTSVT